jgi:methylase of polypeptide subunit release factors
VTPGGEAQEASPPDAVRALGEQLERCGYLETSLPEALEGPEPLATLATLFGLGSAVPASAVAGLDVAALEAEGLLAREGERVRAPLRISVWNGLLMAHDSGGGGRTRSDVVPGPRESAQTLAHLTVRRAGRTVLDLGCGCGPHALLAAGYAERVVATDLNPRAVEITRLGARLNGAAAVEARAGDLYEPVAGERFGLLVSNPPYVVSPDADLLYRDSGLAPGELCRRIVAGAGERLEEGGVASVLCSWATSDGSGRWDALRDWVAGSGCDACAISYGPQDVVEYAARWTALSAGASGASAQAEAIARWVRFYADAGIEAIWFGALVLRRRSGAANWFAGLDATRPPRRSGSAQLERILAAQDVLAGQPDDALLDHPLVPAAPHQLVHALRWDGAGYELADVRLVLEDDIGVDGPVDPLAVHVLVALDGRPVRAVVGAVAAARGLDAAQLAAGSLPSLRRLYERGFLARSS